MLNFDTNAIQTPYFIIDESLIIKNLEVLARVKCEAGCKILLAQKAFSMYAIYPLISRYLDGTCASGLHEAMLAKQHFRGENHVYSPAYSAHEFAEIMRVADHIIFNSFDQWARFRDVAGGKVRGIRINPELSTQEGAIYNPCAPHSRLGVTAANFRADMLDGISGLHFHTLCQQGADALEATMAAVEEKFGEHLHKMQWLNMGGGHHITRDGYDVDALIALIKRTKAKYDIEIYLEPGEAIALNAGYLVAEVLDIMRNDMNIAILDTSAACHMPDVLEMPYRPHVVGSGEVGEKAHTYKLGGPSCLAGDIIGDYSFDEPLKIGDRLVFTDMAIYSMVKTNTFNGMRLPSIALLRKNGQMETLRTFGYEDFKMRLS
ncbi:MAG: carboxynorspermidine decarboxylase [Defluviitaleaceae bacterium]|nr:carboxynorspermidine decarboxylase [Defluviitaleaceae bacterium]